MLGFLVIVLVDGVSWIVIVSLVLIRLISMVLFIVVYLVMLGLFGQVYIVEIFEFLVMCCNWFVVGVWLVIYSELLIGLMYKLLLELMLDSVVVGGVWLMVVGCLICRILLVNDWGLVVNVGLLVFLVIMISVVGLVKISVLVLLVVFLGMLVRMFLGMLLLVICIIWLLVGVLMQVYISWFCEQVGDSIMFIKLLLLVGFMGMIVFIFGLVLIEIFLMVLVMCLVISVVLLLMFMIKLLVFLRQFCIMFGVGYFLGKGIGGSGGGGGGVELGWGCSFGLVVNG